MDGTGGMTPACPTDRLLSVVEIQQALRELRSRQGRGPLPDIVDAGTVETSWSEGDLAESASDASPSLPRIELQSGWVAVVGAHPGAGASCVALLLTDALSAAGRGARLVEFASPTRSGLGAAADAELGVDVTGEWRFGRRGTGMVFRRATDTPTAAWPTGGSAGAVTVVDLGVLDEATTARLAAEPRAVVVCRATVPGVRAAERLLDRLAYPDPKRVVVATVGCSRWPGEVTAAAGPVLRRLRAGGRVVVVPADRRLHVTGATSGPLPRRVMAAGRDLLDRICPARPDADGSAAATSPRQ